MNVQSPRLHRGEGNFRDSPDPTPRQSEVYYPSPGTLSRSFVENTIVKDLYGATTIKEQPQKLICYDPDELTGIRAFAHIGSSIFTSSAVWKNMVVVIGIAIGVALAAFLLIPDPSQVNLTELNAIAAFFKVFIAFMLGLHVSASYQRFQQLVVELTGLFGAVKQTQAELATLNVPSGQRKMVERYGLLSCRLFHFELHEMFESAKKRRKEWSTKFDELEGGGYVLRIERMELEKNLVTSQCDCSSLCWLWIASLITRMAQDGEIPPMASPTYNALLTLSKRDAIKAIRKGKQALAIQMPFPYAHMLATLVHVNNYCLAVICGLQMGTSVGNLYRAIMDMKYTMLGKPITNICTQMVVVLMIPFFYQAFLQVASLMCSPVNHVDFPLPVEPLINKLERELEAQEAIIENPPHWPAPAYKPANQRVVSNK